MSKMTVVREDKNFHKYDEMNVVEFLEFIARIADKRFSSPDLTLLEKLELMLDRILAVVGWGRNVVNSQVEEESESDDEY